MDLDARDFHHTDLPVGCGTVYSSPGMGQPVYSPQRGRTMNAWFTSQLSLQNVLDMVAVSDPERFKVPASCAPGFLFIEQSTPVGLLRMASRDLSLTFVGVSSPSVEALVITNVANVSDLIFDETGNIPERPFLTQFRKSPSHIHISTRRLVERWNRWRSTHPATNCFHILESSLHGSDR